MSYFELKWIDEYLDSQPKVIFDIGSYNGNDAKRFKLNYQNARVIAIEASSENYGRMVNPKWSRGLEEVEIFHLAIGEKDGERIFHDTFGRLNGSGSILKPSSLLFKNYEGTKIKKEKVKCRRIDTFCKEQKIKQIDFIHMDLQAAEYEALVGLGDLRPKMIFLEMGGNTFNCYEDSTDPEPKLREMGYKRLKKLGGDQLWALEKE